MKVEEKLQFMQRLDVAKDIVINIKDDFKLLAERADTPEKKVEYLLFAKNAIDEAIAIGKLQMNIGLVEQIIKNKKEDVKNG